LGLDIYIS